MKSSTATVFGWVNRLASFASRKNRFTTSGSLTRCELTPLIATSRPSQSWRPRSTAPMPYLSQTEMRNALTIVADALRLLGGSR